MPFGSVMLDKLRQLTNAPCPIDDTVLGILMPVRLEQPWNAEESILLALSGTVKLDKLVQLRNAPGP